jgi:hypothetical protein
MVESLAIAIRLDPETMRRIEEKRGDQPKSEFYRKIIIEYLEKPEYKVNTEEQERELMRIQAELDKEKTVSKVYSERIQDLQKSLGWMQLEYQKLSDRLLLPAASAKSWWQFWRK